MKFSKPIVIIHLYSIINMKTNSRQVPKIACHMDLFVKYALCYLNNRCITSLLNHDGKLALELQVF